MAIKKLMQVLYDPRTALFVILLYIMSYYIFIVNETSESENSFFHFGPGTNEENTTKFLGVKINTWKQVIILYIVSFLSAFLTTYFGSVTEDNLNMYVYNPAVSDVPFGKVWTYIIMIISPIIWEIIGLLSLLTTFTLQIQYMIPAAIGGYIANLPLLLNRLGSKKYKW